jgi:hypothetical protein
VAVGTVAVTIVVDGGVIVVVGIIAAVSATAATVSGRVLAAVGVIAAVGAAALSRLAVLDLQKIAVTRKGPYPARQTIGVL